MAVRRNARKPIAIRLENSSLPLSCHPPASETVTVNQTGDSRNEGSSRDHTTMWVRERLMAQPRRFSPEDKLDLAVRSYAAPNIREFSRECGVDRTTLYTWRQELAQAALKDWQSRRLGRPSTVSQETVESLREALRELSERHRALKLEARDWQIWAEVAKGSVAREDLTLGLSRLLLGGTRD